MKDGKKMRFFGEPFTSAVILAAGSGQRFGGDVPKQYVRVGGVPAVIRCARAFQDCDLIKEIVFVCRNGDEDDLRSILNDYGISKTSAVVDGGATRQQSSLKGVEAISEKAKFVAVHDGARCLVTSDIISSVCRAAYDVGAAAAAHKSTDTVKICDKNGIVVDTVDRNSVWLAATPQVFKVNMYLAAAYMAVRDKAEVTDDCMMAERLGFNVKMVECGNDNIKLTGPGDLSIAEGILHRMKSADQ